MAVSLVEATIMDLTSVIGAKDVEFIMELDVVEPGGMGNVQGPEPIDGQGAQVVVDVFMADGSFMSRFPPSE